MPDESRPEFDTDHLAAANLVLAGSRQILLLDSFGLQDAVLYNGPRDVRHLVIVKHRVHYTLHTTDLVVTRPDDRRPCRDHKLEEVL